MPCKDKMSPSCYMQPGKQNLHCNMSFVGFFDIFIQLKVWVDIPDPPVSFWAKCPQINFLLRIFETQIPTWLHDMNFQSIVTISIVEVSDWMMNKLS